MKHFEKRYMGLAACGVSQGNFPYIPSSYRRRAGPIYPARLSPYYGVSGSYLSLRGLPYVGLKCALDLAPIDEALRTYCRVSHK